MTSPLAQLVHERFDVEVRKVAALDVVAHNQHFVVTAPGGPFHATLHDLAEGSTEIDQLEEVHGIVARLKSPSAALAATLRRGVSGCYLEPTALGHLTLRRHAESVACDLNAAQLVAVAREHSSALIVGVPRGARLRQGESRFFAPADTLEAIGSTIETRLAPWMRPEHRSAFRRAVDDVRASSVMDGSAALQPVHGDLEQSNLLVVDGAVQVIDHGCMHWDHPLYDIAHLTLNWICAGYYCGPLDRQRTASYLAAVREVEPEIAPQLLETCCYVMLEKLTAVDLERQLLVARRLAALDELRSLARLASRKNASVT